MPVAEVRGQKLHYDDTGGRGTLTVEGAGHACNVTHPEQVNRAIEDFLG